MHFHFIIYKPMFLGHYYNIVSLSCLFSEEEMLLSNFRCQTVPVVYSTKLKRGTIPIFL